MTRRQDPSPPLQKNHMQMLTFRSELVIKALSLDLQDLNSGPTDLGP